MKNRTEIEEFKPLNIVSLDNIEALGVFSLEQLQQIQRDAYKQGMTDAAD